MSEPVPESVGRFEILGRLGSGGMGEVYAALDPTLKRKVALKRLLPELQADENTRRRMLHEARSAARVHHQHIATLHDVIEVDDALWLVMEHVEGRTLRQLELPLPMERVLDIAVQCAEALAAAHRHGIVHGDVKPANIMVDAEGDVKVLDFGVAGLMAPVVADDATLTQAWRRPGASGATVAYAAPEVLLGRDSDHRADTFALGVVIFELLAGHNPFLGKGIPETSDRILHAVPPPISEIRRDAPADLARILHKTLAKDPRERYATTADLVVDLRAARSRFHHPETTGAPGIAASVPGPFGGHDAAAVGETVSGPGRRRPWVVAAVATAVTALALAVLTSPWWPRSERTADGTGSPSAVTVPAGALGHTVAVLPAPGIGERDADVAALSRGLISVLTARLSQVSRAQDLQVVPASSLQEYEIEGLDAARREMGVTLGVQVDVRRVGQEVRVTTNLIDVAARRQIDADTLIGHLDDVIDLEERVALRVMRMLHVEGRTAQEAVTSGTSWPRAYALYLQGRGYLADYTNPSDVESAIQLFERSLAIDPAFAAAHAGLGEALWQHYVHTKDERWVGEARKECQAAVGLDNELATSHVCLGVVYAGTGQADEAIREFQHAIALDPTLDAALRGLARAYEDSGQLQLAEITYEQAIDARPRYWVGHNWLGTFYMRRGRSEEAAAAFREVLELTPDSSRGFTNLGAAYFNLERWEEARRAFQRALEIRPEDHIALSNLATLAFFEGDYSEAARRFEQALEVNDREYWIWGYLADSLHWGAQVGAVQIDGAEERAVEAYQRALQLGREALEVNPNDVPLLRELALYHAMLGESQPAQRFLERALQHGGSDVTTQVWAAKVYAVLGDGSRSLEHLRTVVEAGYSRAELRADPTFSGLSDDPEFRALTSDQ